MNKSEGNVLFSDWLKVNSSHLHHQQPVGAASAKRRIWPERLLLLKDTREEEEQKIEDWVQETTPLKSS